MGKLDNHLPFRYVFIFLMGATGISIIIAIFAISNTFKIPYWITNDFENWAAIVVEVGIAIFISSVILIYDGFHRREDDKRQKEMTSLLEQTKTQQDKVADLLTKIEMIETKQQKMIDEQYAVLKNQDERIKNWKTRWGTVIKADLQSIKEHYIILEDWLSEYIKNPTLELKSNIVFSAKRNGDIVTMHTKNIVRYLPKIESHFDDPILGLNISHLCNNYPTIFYSMAQEYHWESPNFEPTFNSINEMKKFLDRDIERLSKEIPYDEE